MMELPLDLDGIRRRHVTVASGYPYLTRAERDRRDLLAEVDRLHAEVSRLQAEVTARRDEREHGVAQVGWHRSAGASDAGAA